MTSSACLVSLLLALSLGQKGVVGDLDCGDRSIQCVSTTSYRVCYRMLWGVEYGAQIYTCDTGLVCEQEIGTADCIDTDTSTTTSTTTTETTTFTAGITSAPVPVTCGTNEIHCFNTTTYRSCHTLLGIILLSGDYGVCGTGTTCSETSTEKCVSTTTTTTTTTASTSTSTTTASSVTGPATCNVDRQRWPAAACNQYYQCYLSTWNYYVVLNSCGSGQRYDTTTAKCVADSTCV